MGEAVKFRDLEKTVPFNLPTLEEFGEALLWIKAPLQAFDKAREDFGSKDEGLNAIGNMIFVFLQQLDYLVEHAKLDGKSISGAEIVHPFQIISPKQISDSSAEVENA